MFVFRLSHSGKAVHRIYSTQSQEAFLQWHIEAFEAIDGISTRHNRNDHLISAVTKVLFGRRRDENGRWVLFRSHYGFEGFYFEPGSVGAYEKGGVEGESFSGWSKTFTDPRLGAAIVDRHTFDGTIIETGTDSYRLALTRQQLHNI
jgi:hypothetical protein